MAQYQHIMIATDFSKHSVQVCDKAKELASHYQAQLSICHVVEDFPLTDFAYEPMISVDIDMREAMLQAANRQITEQADKLDIAHTNRWVEFGSPGYDIVRLAVEKHVDLIVVGSHGRRGIRLLLGSTANAILHHAECDVLAVRLQEK